MMRQLIVSLPTTRDVVYALLLQPMLTMIKQTNKDTKKSIENNTPSPDVSGTDGVKTICKALESHAD